MRSNVIRTILIVAMICPSVWAAVWNPDADPNLTFNMNFSIIPTNITTKDAVDQNRIGTVTDYNVTNVNDIWVENGFIGNFADFNQAMDVCDGTIYDCRVTVPGHKIFDFENSFSEFSPTTLRRTFTLWFNVPALNQGTMVRYENIVDANIFWEFRINGGKLQFAVKKGGDPLRMETADSLADLGVLPYTWHFAAVVFNRSEREASEIYVDGVKVDKIVTSYSRDDARIGPVLPAVNAHLWIGKGEKEFDGKLDEVRVFDRQLDDSNISILYQTDYTKKPYALYPYPNLEDVNILTNLYWDPNVSAGWAQRLYFGTNPSVFGTDPNTLKKSGDNTMNVATNAEIGGPLDFDTDYYWRVDSNDATSAMTGPVWMFTTGSGKAYDPVPADGEEDVNLGALNLQWSAPPGTVSYDVYFDTNQVRVINRDPCVLVADDIPDKNTVVTVSAKSTWYYWRVDSNFPSIPNLPPIPNSDVWSFKSEAFPIVFNTDICDVNYRNQIIPGAACRINRATDNNWVDGPNGVLASDGVMIFDFNDPNGFKYDNRYEIIVLPEYGSMEDYNVTHAPLGIHVLDGNFYFDGRMDISGYDALSSEDSASVIPKGRSGGRRGQTRNTGDNSADANFIKLADYSNRYSDYNEVSTKEYWVPAAGAYNIYGLGIGMVPPYKAGGGAGYGGIGGDSGRGFFHGIYAGGPTYGDEEVPVPFGGSGGGWGSSGYGGAGGGGVEIIAKKGDVILDSNSSIIAHGGSGVLVVQYPGGGGAGGSVRIIAKGNVINKGVIDVNGGKGGNGNEKSNNTGGGGGGGRVAIFYKGTKCDANGISAKGGARGVIVSPSPFGNEGLSLASEGKDGTVFVSNGSPRKASAPTPKNGNEMVYCPVADTNLMLKWYSGYNDPNGVIDANDIVLFGTTSNPTTQVCTVSSTRGQKSAEVNINPDTTYYWKVRTVAPDGNVDSDLWSFQTVGWRCMEPNYSAADANYLSVKNGWPEWDSNVDSDIQHDCVITFEDFWYFAEKWRIRLGGESSPDALNLELEELYTYLYFWLDCRGRSDNGCTGW